MSEEKQGVFSYHTFLFPFIWHYSENVGNKIAADGSKWKKKKFRQENDGEDSRLIYNEYQYFHASVRNAIYGETGKVVYNFDYEKPEQDKPKRQLAIKKEIEEENEKKIILEYFLEVYGIKLKVYNTGVAILIFELENYQHRSVDDVLKINEYGRRVFFPYIGGKEKKNVCNLTADIIDLSGIATCDFVKQLEKEAIDYEFLSPLITKVLGDCFSFAKKPKTDCVACELISDDRMFTICLMINDCFAALGEWSEDPKQREYVWETECLDKGFQEQSKLYDFVFIDGNGISCTDRKQRLSLLKKHLYTRWLEYDTFNGITPYSFVGVATDGAMTEALVINPFLTIYTQMAILVLAQRASIIALSKQAFLSSSENQGRRDDSIIELYNQYVKFQNELLFFEVSAQDQGVELYAMLQDSLHIQPQKEALEKQLHNLYEIANIEQDKEMNRLLKDISKAGLAVTIIGLFVAIISTIMAFFS